MAVITFNDKNKDATAGTVETIWRDIDANEVKSVVNENEATLEAIGTDAQTLMEAKPATDLAIAKINTYPDIPVLPAGQILSDSGAWIDRNYTPVLTQEIKTDTTAPNDLLITTGANKTLVLSEPTYRDEYPAMVIPASGSAAPDEVAATIGGVARTMRGFDGSNTQEILSGSFEIPHDYKIGADIEAHVHWRPATSGLGTVIWYLDWEYSPPNAQSQSQTALSVTITLSANRQYYHLLSSFGNLPQPSTPFAIGGKIGFNLRRTPANDTYTGDALLEQISLHVPCDTAGSRQIYIK